MAERVAEGRIPEAAVEAAVAVYNHGVFPGDESEATDIELREMTLTVIEAFVAALPSEWLLARALTKEEIRLLRAGSPTFRGDYGAWDGAQKKLRAALSLLEQEHGMGK